MMYHTAYDVLRNREEAEDAAADALVKICRNLEKFQNREEWEWKLLVRICVRNTAIDRYRRLKKNRTESLEELEWDPAEDGLPEEDFGTLQDYVDRLSEQHRHILILRYVENMKNREIAQLLGIPVSTVATQLLRAKKRLRELYGKDGNLNETK